MLINCIDSFNGLHSYLTCKAERQFIRFRKLSLVDKVKFIICMETETLRYEPSQYFRLVNHILTSFAFI